MIKKIAILTSGGDAPGMNNVIRAIYKAALLRNIELYVILEGYKGLYNNNIQLASKFNIDAYIKSGGTFIFSARFPEFKNPNIREKAKKNLDSLGIQALIAIGGDGTFRGAQKLNELGIKTIAIPATIDNDISSTDFSIGYDTALNSIVENVSRIRDTMFSHERTAIVEVMGNGCGDLALFSAMATGAEIVITNDYKISPEKIGEIVKNQKIKGKRGIIIIVSEKIFSDIHQVAKTVENISGISTRAIVLGHTQRGGSPTALERIRATQMGIQAVEKLNENEFGIAIGISNNKIISIPINDALSIPRKNSKNLAILINKLNQM